MSLTVGCSKQAEELFKEQFNLNLCATSLVSTGTSILTEAAPYSFQIYSMPGDCTACSIIIEYMQTKELTTIFELIQKYMSINARISCFFSIKKPKTQIQEVLNLLKQFPIYGLHLQKSNRDPLYETYMITGILKVPNPVVNNYSTWDKKYPTEHNNNKTTNINQINSEFNLPTLES